MSGFIEGESRSQATLFPERIDLTPSGRKLKKVINQRLTDIHNSTIGDLPKETIDEMQETITTVRENLREYKRQLENR